MNCSRTDPSSARQRPPRGGAERRPKEKNRPRAALIASLQGRLCALRSYRKENIESFRFSNSLRKLGKEKHRRSISSLT